MSRLGGLLGGGGGNAEDRHFHRVGLEKCGEFAHRKEGEFDGFISLSIGFDVEGGDNFEARLLKAAIKEQCQAEVSDANHNDRLQFLCTQDVADNLRKLGNVVSQTPCAELTKVGEVFAKLGRFHAAGLGQRFAGNGLDAVGFEAVQTTKINGEPINYLPRDFALPAFLRSEGFSSRVLFCVAERHAEFRMLGPSTQRRLRRLFVQANADAVAFKRSDHPEIKAGLSSNNPVAHRN